MKRFQRDIVSTIKIRRYRHQLYEEVTNWLPTLLDIELFFSFNITISSKIKTKVISD